MKTLITVILAVLFVSNMAVAQKKMETVVYQTSAQCEMCKASIEKEMNLTKGIKSAELDNETKQLRVTYRTKRITEAKIKKIVSDLGYDIGDVEGDKESYGKLPTCCKKQEDR